MRHWLTVLTMVVGALAAPAWAKESPGSTTSQAAESGEKDVAISPAEQAFWDSVKGSNDPDEIAAYLSAYPDGHYAEDARAMMQSLGSELPESSVNVAKKMPALNGEDKGFIGINIQAPSRSDLKKFGLSEPRGAVVNSLIEYGPAKHAGLAEGDLVLQLDGQIVADPKHLSLLARERRPGDRIVVLVRRNAKDEEHLLTVTERGRSTYEAALNGSLVAMMSMARLLDAGDIFKKDRPAATAWFRQACEGGSSNACWDVGQRHFFGRAGLAKDPVEAANWYRKGAALGHSQCMNALGQIYDFGLGHAQDHEAAVSWYRKAIASNGDVKASAMLNLGIKYLKGEGVKKDADEYFRLLTQAANMGHRLSVVNLGWAYATGRGVKKNVGEALKLWTQAGNEGSAHAWMALADHYEHGKGVPKDRKKAIGFYRKAAALDEEKALKKLKEFGVPTHDAEEIQRLLANLGYDPGPIDGVIGRQVRSAILAFEKDRGLKQTGAASFELQKKLAQEQRRLAAKPSGGADDAGGSLDLETLD